MREIRRYSLSEAARMLNVSITTLRRWVDGYWYKYKGKETFKEPIIGTWFNPNTQKRYILGATLDKFLDGKISI